MKRRIARYWVYLDRMQGVILICNLALLVMIATGSFKVVTLLITLAAAVCFIVVLGFIEKRQFRIEKQDEIDSTDDSKDDLLMMMSDMLYRIDEIRKDNKV